MTQDIDVVIDPVQAKARIEALVGCFAESDFMFNEESMRLAVATGEVFQLLDELETLKLDVYPREMIPGELDRSEQLEIFEGRILAGGFPS